MLLQYRRVKRVGATSCGRIISEQPTLDVMSAIGHIINAFGNTVTQTDTNFIQAAASLQKRYPGLKIFNCP